MFEPFMLLNSNADKQLQDDSYGRYDLLVAAGSIELLETGKPFFASLRNFHDKKKDWVFGYMSYDLKNQTEHLVSENPDGIGAPDYHFFCPKYIIVVKNNEISIHYDTDVDDQTSVINVIKAIIDADELNNEIILTEIRPTVSKEEYLSTFKTIQQHIHRGDVYELNYCIEFFAKPASINPQAVYLRLNELSPMPFSAFIRTGDIYLLCASPERYLARRKEKIISQPIKGTAKRGVSPGEDALIVSRLASDPKEQSENVMIVDMVRNDLSRTAKPGNCIVEELFKVKTFRQLHQLVFNCRFTN